MLRVLLGGDRKKLRDRLAELRAKHAEKNPTAPILRLEAETFTPAGLGELLGAVGLFGGRTLAVLDGILAAAGGRLVLERAAELAASPTLFLLVEEKIPAADLRALAAHAEKIERFEKDSPAGERAALFPLTDAFGARDRRTLWVRYQEAKLRGASDEEVHAMLSWQARAMYLASVSRSAAEAGMKPYPFSKAKVFSRNFSAAELRELPGKLVALYHDARRGAHDLDAALELFLLSL